MFDIESIQALYNGDTVRHTRHFEKRIKERGITKNEVAHALLCGEIIEQNLNDEPLPSILILGYTKDNTPLHIAVSVDDDLIWLITAYYPALSIWESDCKTRRTTA
jgi:hypothetical protein